MKKLLEERLTEQEEAFSRKLSEIYKKRNEQLQRQDPLSAGSLFGDQFADLLKNNEGDKLATIAESASASFQKMSEAAGNFGTIAGGAFKSFADGLGQVVEAWVLTGETGPAALRKLTAAVLAQVAAQAAVKAIFELAEGFALLFWNPAAAASHFTAAALYGSVAVVAGVAGRAIAPASSPSPSTSSSASSSSSNTRIYNQDTGAGIGPVLTVDGERVSRTQSSSSSSSGSSGSLTVAGVKTRLGSYQNTGYLNGLSGSNLTNRLLGDIAEFVRRIMLSFDRYVEYTPAARKGSSIIKNNLLGVLGSFLGFDSGGYTGSGLSSSVAGLVHKDEYVFSSAAVRNIGLSRLDSLHQSGISGTPSNVGAAALPRGFEIHARVEPGIILDVFTKDYKNNGLTRHIIRNDS